MCKSQSLNVNIKTFFVSRKKIRNIVMLCLKFSVYTKYFDDMNFLIHETLEYAAEPLNQCAILKV
jgi:hypothetical protein